VDRDGGPVPAEARTAPNGEPRATGDGTQPRAVPAPAEPFSDPTPDPTPGPPLGPTGKDRDATAGQEPLPAPAPAAATPTARRRAGLPTPDEAGGFFDGPGAGPGRDRPARPGAAWQRLLRTMRPRVSRGQLLAATLCALLGFALVVQVRQTQVQGLSQLRQADLVRVLSGITDRSQQLYETGLELQRTLDRLESGSGSSREAQQAARERLDVLGILAGTAPARGPGIRLDIDDPRGEVDASVLLDTVQELRDAGAEAMQIGNVRIVAGTAFVDGDPGVDVDGTPLRPPYRFTVIGDPQTLASAVDIPGGVLEVLRQKGAQGKVTTAPALDVDALHTLAPAEYARPAVDATP
jgi:uncharacterized protein YlxW (UPF0749 family)